MNISPVSFSGAAQSSSFQDKISRPQAYTSNTTAAASGIKEDGKGKKSTAKKIAGVVIGAVAIAAGLAVGAKKGLFKPVDGGKLNTVKNVLNQAGNYIADTAIKVKDTVLSKLPKAAEDVAANVDATV